MIRKLLISIGAITLSGCSLFTPVKINPPTQYVINKVPAPIYANRKHSAAVVLVSQPEVNESYDTKQMAYSVKPYEISYFVKNQWVGTPARMLQPLIVQALQNTHSYRAVVSPPYSGHYDYILSTHILELLQDFTHSPPTLRLRLNAELIKTATNKTIAAKQFVIFQPMACIYPYAGVYAANIATMKMLDQLTRFTMENSR